MLYLQTAKFLDRYTRYKQSAKRDVVHKCVKLSKKAFYQNVQPKLEIPVVSLENYQISTVNVISENQPEFFLMALC